MSTAPEHEWVPDDTLAARLVLVRRQLGLTQREAADACGLTFGEWQSMEDGRQARGLDSKVARISLSLRVNREWLMWGGPLASGKPGPGKRVAASKAAADPEITSAQSRQLARLAS